MKSGGEMEFLRNLQRLLDEGDFSATYKFALLQALADLAVEEHEHVVGAGGLILSLDRIAEKFIEYYWRQAVPFGGEGEEGGLLSQNAGRQAAIVNAVIEARASYDGKLMCARLDAGFWKGMVRRVASTVEKMPLWKLQIVAGQPKEFLYRREDFKNRSITLLPGVASHLRAFHWLVSRLVRGRWVERVRTMATNRALVGEALDLEEFLFGSERRSLEPYRTVLREFQGPTCFYCERQMRGGEAVDHFVPWSRYPADLGHNFVLAHAGCNSRKSDFLAHPDHLARWVERNRDLGVALAAAFDDGGLPHDQGRSAAVAHWAYDQGEQAEAHAWLRGKELVQLNGDWRRYLVA